MQEIIDVRLHNPMINSILSDVFIHKRSLWRNGVPGCELLRNIRLLLFLLLILCSIRWLCKNWLHLIGATLPLQLTVLLSQWLFCLFIFLQLFVCFLKISLQFFNDLMQSRNRFIFMNLLFKTLDIHFDLLGSLCEFQGWESLVDRLVS